MAMISVKRRNTSARLLDNFCLATRTIVASHTKTVCSCVRSTLAPTLPYTHFCMLRVPPEIPSWIEKYGPEGRVYWMPYLFEQNECQRGISA